MATAREIKGFSMYPCYRDSLARLSDADRGKLLLSLFDYYEGVDTSHQLSDGARMAFAFISARMDSDMEKYRKRCATNRENAEKRWPVRSPKETAGADEEEG